MGLLMGLCIGLIVVALGGLVIYVLLTGGARKEFDELAQRVEKETVGLPAGQTPKAYADLKAENPDFVGWIKIEGTSLLYRQRRNHSIIFAAASRGAIPSRAHPFSTHSATWKRG